MIHTIEELIIVINNYEIKIRQYEVNLACFYQNYDERKRLEQKKKVLKKQIEHYIQEFKEKTKIEINGLTKRYDIVVYQPDGSIFLLVECKQPKIEINQNTFDQIARYNLVLKAKYLMVTNGLNHYFCQMDFENEKYVFLRELPEFNRL